MKVALAQMKVLPGQTRKNLEKMKSWIQKYDENGFDVIVFPELCVGGYLVGDLWYDPDWIREQLEATEEIVHFLRSKKLRIGVIFGSIRSGVLGERNQDGRPRLYNSAYLAQWNPARDETRVQTADKSLLPNYRFFDDKRYFSPGGAKSVQELVLRDGTTKIVGMEVCEDMWHDDYPQNPTGELCQAGAQVIFNISASPYSYGKRQSRDRVIQSTLAGIAGTKSLGNPQGLETFIYVNCVGSQNNGKNILTFDGDSGVYNPLGIQHLGSNNLFQEEVIEYDSQETYKPFVCENHPKVEMQLRACVEGIRSLDDLMGDQFPYILGVSGGVDSAVVLCLVEQAVGPKRIRAFNLPSQYNSTTTQGNAQHLCNQLDIPLGILPIHDLTDHQVLTLKASGFPPSVLQLENIQAKVRGTSLLSNLAGILGGVMTNNGNKLEVALGYSTLYGDVNGAVAPLGDLLKIEVWEMAQYLNEVIYQREVVPKNIIMNLDTWEVPSPPSAELKSNQVDPMKWGYHDALFAYLLTYQRGSAQDLIAAHQESPRALAEILAKAVDFHIGVSGMENLLEKYNLRDREVFRQDLIWVLNTMDRAVFKRIQSPPIIVQSKAAYGYDIRESQLRRNRIL